MSINTTPTTPTTLLEAINKLLSAIRAGTIVSLANANMSEDAAAAKTAIDDTSRELQLEGWEWNTERDLVLDPDLSTGQITLGNNMLKVVGARCGSRYLVPRAGKLYDPLKHTFNIGASATVDAVVALEFADLTEAMRAYVTAVAARRFCLPRLPAASTFQYTEEFAQTAKARAEQENQDMLNASLKATSPHFHKMSRR